jgi:enamidase
LTSTLTVLETVTPGRPVPPGLDALDPILRDQVLQRKAAVDRNAASTFASLYPKLAKLDVAFFRAGGLLLTGTDPTGIAGVIAGYSNQRALELLAEAGLAMWWGPSSRASRRTCW